jgi:hypothetical protein
VNALEQFPKEQGFTWSEISRFGSLELVALESTVGINSSLPLLDICDLVRRWRGCTFAQCAKGD